MRILALTPRLPYPPAGGDKKRAFEFLFRLARAHRVDLLSFIEHRDEQDQARALEALHPNIHVQTVRLPPAASRWNCLLGLASRQPLQIHYYRSRRMQRLVDRHLREHACDAVYIHLLRMAEYVRRRDELPRVLDLTDALSMVNERALRYRRDWFRLVNRIEAKRLRRYEVDVLPSFTTTTLVSEVDKAYLVSLGARPEHITVINNGVDTQYFTPSSAERDAHRLVFVGNMHSFGNRDAALQMLEVHFPAIRQMEPEACLDVVGINPPPSVLQYDGRPGIRVTGPVPDVRPYIAQAAVNVCPVRAAAGVQNKVLESMAMGVPSVITPEALEGLGARDGQDGIIVAEDDDAFAQAVVTLIREPKLRDELGRNARAFVEANYNWDRQVALLETCLRGSGAQVD